MTEKEIGEELLDEIKELNKEYFGTASIISDNPSQLARYNSAVVNFWNEQKNSLLEYFTNLNWYVTSKCDAEGFGDIIGEKNSIRITFSREYCNMLGILYYLTIENNIGESEYDRRVYLLDVDSAFMKNPHYEPVTPDVRYPFKSIGPVPSDNDKLKVWVDDIRTVIEHNRNLGKNYNFHLIAGLWDGINYNFNGVKYKNLVELIKKETGEGLL